MLLHHTRFACFVGVLALVCLGVGAVDQTHAALINLTPSNGVNSSTSVPLSQLTSGQFEGVTVGDKIFTGFNYDPIGDMPAGSAVNVLGFRDPSGNWGVSFHGAFLDLPGGGASDAVIRFAVEVAPGFFERGFRISDAHLFLGGAGVGAGSSFAVDETFLESNNSMSVYTSTLGPGAQKLSDSTVFSPTLRRLTVTKDILALAGNNSALPARATVIDQSFSQTPEPTALLLAVIGIGSLGIVRRRIS